MGTINFPGLATGIDTGALVKQLMEVEKQRLYRYESKKTDQKERQDAYTELKSRLDAYLDKVEALSDSSDLKAYNAVSSDSDYITVDADSSASEGSHSVQIKQLATSDRWVHDGFKYSTSYVGAGNFIISYNNEELVIQTTEDTTLEDLVGLINNDSDNPGITASILKYDDGSDGVYHLVLSGDESGSDYQITINDSNTEVHTADSLLLKDGENAAVSTKLEDLDGFSGEMESGSTSDQIRITGTQHDGTAVDVSFDVTQYTTIEDVLGEIEEAFGDTVSVTYSNGEIKVTDTTSGVSSLTISLSFVPGVDSTALLTLPTFSQSTAGGSVSASVASLAAATFTETQSAQDSLIKVDDYPPGADEWISRSTNTVDDVIAGVTLKLHDTTEDGLGGYNSISVNLTRDTETLKEMITEMVDAYNSVVMFIQEKTKIGDVNEGEESGVLANDYSVTTIWNQIRAPFVSAAGGFSSDDEFTMPSDIGLTLGSDKMLSLDSGDLSEAISEDYLAVLSLIGAVKTGSSNSEYIKFYGASKYTTAQQFHVKVVVDGSGEITSAKIWSEGEDESNARDASFEAGSNVIIGNSDFDSLGNPIYAENGLQLTVDLNQLGQTLEATVFVKQGFAGASEDVLDEILDSTNGRVSITQDAIKDAIKNLNEKIYKEEDRLEKIENRLILKYARLETLLQSINQQMAGLNML